MNERLKQSWDLSSIVALSLLLVLSIALVPDLPFRVIFGMPFLLFFPGYALIAFLFPEKKSLDVIERVALSFGLSIAITPLIGLGLNYTPFGIRLEPILASITLFNLAFCFISYWRRYKIEEPYVPFDPLKMKRDLLTSYKKESKIDRTLSIILVLAILSSVVALVYVVAVPSEGEKFTEFYILGSGGKASGYPSNLTVDQEASVFVGIANHEHRQVHYYVQVWIVNASFVNNQTQIHHMYYYDQFDVLLNHTNVNLEGKWQKQWEKNYSFGIPIQGNYKLWFFLFKDEVPAYAWDLTKMTDYAGSETNLRVQEAVTNQLLSLNLNLRVT